MAALERTYTIPLRKEWLKSVKYKRAKKAVRAIREFLMRHMKVELMENIKLGKYLNLELWKHSIKRPPSRVKVNVTKDDKGVVRAELFGAPKEVHKVEAPKKPSKSADEQNAKPATAPAKKETAEKKVEPAKAETTQAKPAAPAPQPVAPAKQPASKQQPQIIR